MITTMHDHQTRIFRIVSWDLFPAIIWFNFAYLVADLSSICCILMVAAGFSQLVHIYYDSLSVKTKIRVVNYRV